MNLENGDKLLSDIRAVISKCCNSSEFLVQNEKDSSGNSFFKIYSDSILNINLEELSERNFNICFEKCRIKLLCLSNKKIKINSNLFFESCFFEEIEISNVYFLRQFKISQFNNIEAEQIVKDIKFNNCIFNDFILEKNKFKNNIYFGQKTKIKKMHLYENEFEQYFSIQKCLIGSIDLWKNKFKNRCYFVDSIFLKIDKFGKFNFSNAHFEDNVYFNNSHFKDYTDFHECEFEKTACFYGVVFDKTPNFSQAIFKGNLNVVNTNLNFTFDDLQEKIKQEYEDCNKDKEEQDKKPLDKFANDFRDSFRTFKSALIKDNNLIDASNFHKYELYCKEIELKQNWNQRGKNVKSMADVEKNIWRIRDLVDFLLLGFDRKLCDHHTDFLKVFNNLILLIILYALFFSGFAWLYNDKFKETKTILTLFGFFDSYKFYFEIGSTICVVFGCGLFVCKLKSYEAKKNISKKQKINFIYIINDFWNWIKSLYSALFISCIFYGLFSLFGFLLNLGKDFGYSLFINTLFVSLYICLVYTKSLFFGRYVVLVLSYIGFFIVLIKQPSIIHPLIGKIANETDKDFAYPSLIVLNILYTILLALVLFSLQKTARKNSIVPS